MPIFLSTSKTIAVATVALATLLGTGHTALAIPTATPNSTLSTRQTGYAINLGTVENAGLYAWVAGENRCTGERNFVAPAGENPCDRPFTMGERYIVNIDGLFALEGCGGPLWLTHDGELYMNCVDFSEKGACGLETLWRCS
ncbi:hypothetical protein B0H13DRAFT_2076105 [Mycena leptocephala]|nr:hypothetical protein B0H13DRAFT_2076105 [Mycena leptocephala]